MYKNVETVVFSQYLTNLVNNLFRSYNIDSKRIHLHTEIGPHQLKLETAINCGLILNELISNSLKHAFPSGTEGIITIKLSQNAEKRYFLIVSDNGKGMPAGFNIDTSTSLGLHLVYLLVQKLKGECDTSQINGSGTHYLIQFQEE